MSLQPSITLKFSKALHSKKFINPLSYLMDLRKLQAQPKKKEKEISIPTANKSSE
jgi:hypothetical protein